MAAPFVCCLADRDQTIDWKVVYESVVLAGPLVYVHVMFLIVEDI